MVGSTLGLLLVGLGGTAQATEVDLLDDTGDGYAIYGVDETGTLRGCGDTGIAFDPLGAIAPPAGAPTFGVSTPSSGGASQANCSSAVYLFLVSSHASPVRTVFVECVWGTLPFSAGRPGESR